MLTDCDADFIFPQKGFAELFKRPYSNRLVLASLYSSLFVLVAEFSRSSGVSSQ
jgi:nitrate/nitrite transporter NarK